MPLRTLCKWLLILALALPPIQAVLIWVRALLASMNDAPGAQLVAHIGTVCLVAWAICLVGLVIVLAMIVVCEESREPSVAGQEPEDH